MATVTAGSYGLIRMDLIDFGSYASGTVVSQSSTSMVVNTGLGFLETFSGSGVAYNSAGAPIAGTITGFQETYNGTVTYAISNASISANGFYGFAVNNDTNGALTTIFAGDDQETGGSSKDFLRGYDGNDILSGGADADTIYGGAGNDHIYGGSITGGLDGADSLLGGVGDDYIQGNAGNDTIYGGDGVDRINGGADNDLLFGEAGNDSINGNRGNDTIDGGLGDDYLRGGQGDDSIMGSQGNDVLLGDLGNDTLVGGAGIDQLTGGAGNDVFKFAAGDSTYATSGPLAYWPDVIMDFTSGQDKISLGFATNAVLSGTATDAAGAASIAQALISNHAGVNEVAAVQVGNDTYLFFNGAGNSDQVDSGIELLGVRATAVVTSDFV